MTTETDPNYQKGLELAETGKHEQALACIQEHLQTKPDDAEVLNDAGAILHCLGRSDEAIEHFVKAKENQGDSAEIMWNLSEAYLAAGRAKEAMSLFGDMERMGILNVDLLNRTANLFLDQDAPADALDMLLWSQRICPEQEILEPMIEIIRHKIEQNKFESSDAVAESEQAGNNQEQTNA